MQIEINKCHDAELIANLNKTVQNLHAETVPENFKPWDYNSVLPFFTEKLKKDDWFCYTADVDEKPVGFVLFTIRKFEDNPFRKAAKSVYIDQISVLPDYQRSGAGTALMEYVEKFAEENSIKKIELTYWIKNVHAARFYEKHGYKTRMKSVYKELN